MEVNSGRFDGRANLKPWKPGQAARVIKSGLGLAPARPPMSAGAFYLAAAARLAHLLCVCHTR
jgi:hypothetical protein